MIELTEEQRRELNGTEPLAVNPDTNETFVLVRKDGYQWMRAIIDGITQRAGWDDPKLDEYECYRKKP